MKSFKYSTHQSGHPRVLSGSRNSRKNIHLANDFSTLQKEINVYNYAILKRDGHRKC